MFILFPGAHYYGLIFLEHFYKYFKHIDRNILLQSFLVRMLTFHLWRRRFESRPGHLILES